MSDPMEPPRKRAKLDETGAENVDARQLRQRRSAFLSSLSRSVTPPLRNTASLQETLTPHGQREDSNAATQSTPAASDKRIVIRSPFQLTHIRDLPADHNVDAVRVTDILGDPMIRECWQFNYLFDVDWLMAQFDSDTRDLVQVKIVHGSWKREAPNRIGIEVGHYRMRLSKLTWSNRKHVNDSRT